MPSPNLLFVFTDQPRYTAAGFNGNAFLQTPHLDRFASQGLVMDNAFSSCPICSPYRGQLLSGRYSHSHGNSGNRGRAENQSSVTIADGTRHWMRLRASDLERLCL